MYKGRSIITVLPAYNEETKAPTVARVPRDVVDTVLVVDDGSTDATAEGCREAGAEVITLDACLGVGAAIRCGLQYAREHRFAIATIMAGNNKDEPLEIPRLLDPICDADCDFVQGSRFLPGGSYGGGMPIYRQVATRLHPLLMGLFVHKWLTESTNGFRALKVSLLEEPGIDLDQSWLDQYELEQYLLYKVLRLGYKHREVPCTKIYPVKGVGYTKMRRITGWWSILRPLFLLGFGLRK